MARRINLVPRSERPRTRTDWGLLVTVGLFIIVVFGLAFGYYMFSDLLDERKQELADVEAQTVRLEQQVAALQQYERLAADRENIQNVVQNIYSGRTLLSDVLDAISLVIPDNTWFQSLQLSASDPGVKPAAEGAAAVATAIGTVSIQGETYSFEDVSRFIVRLQLIPALTDVALQAASENEVEGDAELTTKGFTIGASVVNTARDVTLPLTDVEVEDK